MSRGRRATFSGEAHAAVEAIKQHNRSEMDAEEKWPTAMPAALIAARQRRSSLGGDSLEPPGSQKISFTSLPNMSSNMLMKFGRASENESVSDLSSGKSERRFSRGLSFPARQPGKPPLVHPNVAAVKRQSESGSISDEEVWPTASHLRSLNRSRSSLGSASPAGSQSPVARGNAKTSAFDQWEKEYDPFAENDEDEVPTYVLPAVSSRAFSKSCSLPARGRRATMSGELNSVVEMVKRTFRAEQIPEEDTWPCRVGQPARQFSRSRSSLSVTSAQNS
eukprot:scaffold259953_cov42-Prasinocladus_malaysianus.AAC.2